MSCDITTDAQLLLSQVLCQVCTTIVLTRTMIAAIKKWMLMIYVILKTYILTDDPPRSTVKVGPYAPFLANMPNWNDVSQENFNKEFAALPLPLEGSSPSCCSIHEAIQASILIIRYNVRPHSFISYPSPTSYQMISYLIYVTLISYPISFQ